MATLLEWLEGGDHLDANMVRKYRERALRVDGEAWRVAHNLPPFDQIPGFAAYIQSNVSAAKPDQPRQPNPVKPVPRGLGDVVESALTAVGITSARVSAWIGAECGCAARKQRLNDLSAWATAWWAGAKTEPPIGDQMGN